jgi:hypothetical protein
MSSPVGTLSPPLKVSPEAPVGISGYVIFPAGMLYFYPPLRSRTSRTFAVRRRIPAETIDFLSPPFTFSEVGDDRRVAMRY